jgi:hypothetical protein
VFRVFLGTSKLWWIASGLLFVLGLAIFGTGSGGTLGSIVAVLLIVLAMVSFAAAPMRYGQGRDTAKTEASDLGAPAPLVPEEPPRPGPQIEAGDASEV